MPMMRSLILLGLALAAVPAAAQQRAIEVPATARWQHARSQVILPVAIDGLQRSSIAENIADEVDIIAHYGDDDTRVSVILFRPQQNDVGFWFDRAEIALANNHRLIGIAPGGEAPVAFAATPSGPAAGLRRSYSSSGTWRATATALVPAGRWLIKIRASSANRSVAEVDALIDAALAAIRLPQPDPLAPPRAARAIAPCPDAVRWRSARAIAPTMEDAILGSFGSLLVQSASDNAADGETEGETAAEPADAAPTGLADPALCRDAADVGQFTVYRVPGSDTGYWLGFSDSGIYAVVSPSLGAQLMDRNPAQRSVSLLSPTRTEIYSSFNRTPAPRQVVQLLQGSRPIASTNFDPERPNGDTVINVGTPR